MMRLSGVRGRGFTLFEFAVSVVVLGVLIAVLLARTLVYREEADRAGARRLVAGLRTVLQIEAGKAFRQRGERGVRLLAEANPLDLLEQKPTNYLGEYYSPELEKMPGGNWVFDRRDKTLIYLLSSHKSFSAGPSKLIKFKVEFVAVPQTPKVANGSGEIHWAVVLEELEMRSETD